MKNEIKESDFIKSLEKGLNVIHAFTDERKELTLTEVAKLTGLTRANARRILLTLQYLGYVSCPDNKYFRLTPKILSLGYSYLSGLSFRELAMPYMRELSQVVNESSSLSVLDANEIVYIARVHTQRIMTISLAIGTRLPVYATSMGKVLLADMPEKRLNRLLDETDFVTYTEHTLKRDELLNQLKTIKQQGYAISDQELEIGVRSLAAPIRNNRGEVIAAMNISGHASRTTIEEMIANNLPALLHAASQTEAALNHI